MESLSEFWSGMKSDLELLLPFLDTVRRNTGTHQNTGTHL